jgi:ABC-type multidrug transport system ATPase subunit
MTTQPAITTELLTKRYGDRVAVDGLTLQVAQGEVFGLLGPNGAGKTTTIAMLLGLLRPSAGRALVLGHDMAREPGAALARVGAMIEAPAFYPYLSGYDNLLALTLAGGLPRARVTVALEAVELTERAHDKVRAYSQGMRQRLAIAAALLPDPELIILDEPTNGLDPAGTAEIRALIRELAAGGRTVLLCSHMLHEVEQLCGRVAILKAGRLIAEGRVAELLRRGEGLRVRVERDGERALQLARELPWVTGATLEGDLLLIEGPAANAAELNAHLALAGVPVAEIGARGASLEEFFLDVTGEP